MEGYKVALLVGLFLCAITCSAKDVSVECMMAYEEGGAPSVFRSSNCPQWVFPTKSSSQNQLEKCESATLQGWRDYQEDRMACNPAMKIPFLGKGGQKDVEISVAGVFDGHGGKEASELASKKFLDYFSLHVVFINYKRAFHHKITSENSDSIEPSDDASFYAILEEALRRTFEDIDLEFSQEALRRGYRDGSTGTVVLMVNGKVLVGYVGDSKAILYQHQVDDSEGNLVGSCADELTIDHHPDREDEKARIEAAGGFVRVWGVPRVNGILAMSRSIGDIPLKRYGVIAEPEISWWNLTSQNSYLIVGSDGIFESLTPTDICEILHQTSTRDSSSNLYSISAALSSSSPTPSLAECIVNAAFKKGSTDNISVIVIPLEPQRS